MKTFTDTLDWIWQVMIKGINTSNSGRNKSHSFSAIGEEISEIYQLFLRDTKEFHKKRNFTVSSLSFAVTELPLHWGKQTNKQTKRGLWFMTTNHCSKEGGLKETLCHLVRYQRRSSPPREVCWVLRHLILLNSTSGPWTCCWPSTTWSFPRAIWFHSRSKAVCILQYECQTLCWNTFSRMFSLCFTDECSLFPGAIIGGVFFHMKYKQKNEKKSQQKDAKDQTECVELNQWLYISSS